MYLNIILISQIVPHAIRFMLSVKKKGRIAAFCKTKSKVYVTNSEEDIEHN